MVTRVLCMAFLKNSNCRFSVALGLRTLTLQTGDVLQEHLGIKKDELAVPRGFSRSQAIT